MLVISDRVDVHEETLGGLLADPELEVSGLAWNGDQLVVLPQYPSQAPALGCLPLISGEALGLLASSGTVVTSGCLQWVDSGLPSQIDGFDGFEAIAFDGRHAFLLVEAKQGGRAVGYFVRAVLEGPALVLELDTLLKFPAQVVAENLGYEALVVLEEGVLVMHEANGAVNGNPKAFLVNRDGVLLREVQMPLIEYRVTDATASEQGRFWVSNYHYEGDLWPAGLDCPAFFSEFFQGFRGHPLFTSLSERPVERLMELRWDPTTGTVEFETVLNISVQGEGRNWEGIAKGLGGGFVLFTDKYPRSILGRVPKSVSK